MHCITSTMRTSACSRGGGVWFTERKLRALCLFESTYFVIEKLHGVYWFGVQLYALLGRVHACLG
jgi:hypothetical protein